MTLHEDWHKAHPNYPCEYDTCPRGQVLDLENATYTAAEVKVLTAKAREETAEEIAQAIERYESDARSSYEAASAKGWDATADVWLDRAADYKRAAQLARKIGGSDAR